MGWGCLNKTVLQQKPYLCYCTDFNSGCYGNNEMILGYMRRHLFQRRRDDVRFYRDEHNARSLHYISVVLAAVCSTFLRKKKREVQGRKGGNLLQKQKDRS